MDINISPLDKVADAAKDFLQKVITPPLEELGLLAADRIKLWRFKNQVNVLAKAEAILKKRNLSTRKVSLKVMTPLLEEASIEEESSLQEKWAVLIANTVSENSQIDTTLYSHILSQLTKEDAGLFQLIFSVCSLQATDREYKHQAFPVKDQRKSIDNLDIQLDNLIRLRLVKEVTTRGLEINAVALTDLGFRFMEVISE